MRAAHRPGFTAAGRWQVIAGSLSWALRCSSWREWLSVQEPQANTSSGMKRQGSGYGQRLRAGRPDALRLATESEKRVPAGSVRHALPAVGAPRAVRGWPSGAPDFCCSYRHPAPPPQPAGKGQSGEEAGAAWDAEPRGV